MDTILYLLSGQTCILRRLTGFYCPGCGGTRALLALLEGRPLRSFLYHPAVLYAALLLAAAFFTGLIRLVSRGKMRGLSFRSVYLWFGAALVLANWALRNGLLLIFGEAGI